jgi:hypothetical protein
MNWLLAVLILGSCGVAVIAILSLREMNLRLHEQLEQARKDRQSLTNSLLRDLNKPVFPDAPMQVKPTQQWFAGRTVLVPPSPSDSNEQQ